MKHFLVLLLLLSVPGLVQAQQTAKQATSSALEIRNDFLENEQEVNKFKAKVQRLEEALHNEDNTLVLFYKEQLMEDMKREIKQGKERIKNLKEESAARPQVKVETITSTGINGKGMESADVVEVPLKNNDVKKVKQVRKPNRNIKVLGQRLKRQEQILDGTGFFQFSTKKEYALELGAHKMMLKEFVNLMEDDVLFLQERMNRVVKKTVR